MSEFETERTLSPEERESLDALIGIALDELIDGGTRGQTVIDCLSIASALVAADSPDKYGIAPGNVPEDALPPSYDIEKENV